MEGGEFVRTQKKPRRRTIAARPLNAVDGRAEDGVPGETGGAGEGVLRAGHGGGGLVGRRKDKDTWGATQEMTAQMSPQNLKINGKNENMKSKKIMY